MIREKIQRNHKVEVHQIIFVHWRKNEHTTGNYEHYRSACNLKKVVPRE